MQDRYGGNGRYGGGRRYSVKPRFFLILALIVGLAIWAAVALSSRFGQAKIEYGGLSSNQAITAIVLRDEQVVQAGDSGRLSCIAAEGESVTKGTPVATLFLSDYSDKDNESLLNLENEIKDYQKNSVLKDTVYPDLNTINKQIDDKMNEISADVISRNTNSLAAAEQDLKTLMDQRTQYMHDIIDKPDDTLQRYYEQEATLQAKIDQTQKSVTAPADGLVSFYLDGYETALTVNGINDMTPDKVKELQKEILSGSHQFTSTDIVSAQQSIFRVVNPAQWYAVVLISSRDNRFVQGASCDVTFDGLQKTVTTKVIKVATEGGTSLAVLQVPEGVQEMISTRIVTGHLGQDIEGFRVPLNMVSQENGRYYIALQGTGSNVRIEVHVLGEDDRYAIIEEASGGGDLEIGMPLVKP